MLQYTEQQKEQAKAARKAFKQKESIREKEHKINKEIYEKRKEQYRKREEFIIRTGILESEHLLSDDYPVYADFIYVIDDNGGMIIRCNLISGSVRDLKRDLRALGKQALNVIHVIWLNEI